MNKFTIQKVLISIFTLSLYSLTAIAGGKHSDVSSSDQDNHAGEVVRMSNETAIQNGISATYFRWYSPTTVVLALWCRL